MRATRERAKKATFSLRPEVLAALDEAVAQHAAPSKNALVERALVKELREVRSQVRARRWEEASRDPLFLKDIEEIESTFRSADAETARQLN
jgi:hypothetical protein